MCSISEIVKDIPKLVKEIIKVLNLIKVSQDHFYEN